MNQNLVSIDKLKRIAREKGLMKYIKEIGYSKVKDKKYYVISIDDKKVNFGYIKMQDYLINHDEKRREAFKNRFKKVYEKNKNNYNKPIFWSYNLTW